MPVPWPAGNFASTARNTRATTPAGRRHAAVRTVSVWLADAGLSFGQAQIGEKTNEKTAIPALLDALDVAGSIVTIGAIACQPTHRGTGHGGRGRLRYRLEKERKNLV
ncbi:MAG: hypothetical protein WKG07_26100 [Hymenobacter sp.]